MNKCQLVRDTCQFVFQKSKHVKINEENLKKFADSLDKQFRNGYKYTEFGDYECHFSQSEGGDEALLEYLFVLDSLNFCFWPESAQKWEYDDLALTLKNAIKKDRNVFKPENLAKISYDFVYKEIFQGIQFPLLNERVRILREVGQITVEHFEGSFANILKKSEKSAVKLLFLLTSFYNNFQDTAIYEGHQICFYKRSQIFIGDLYSSFQGKSFGEFTDIDQVTMFPDYRVPQILNQEKILEYSEILDKKIAEKEQLPHGSDFEIEIRAATVECVEQLKNLLFERGHKIMAIEVDWILWQKGEAIKDEIVPHHRVLSIFY
ncbi:hypothetical protein PPERSA_03705 [Pseudocohnilembus persalinus]|uniref:Queuosine 5'-phosphate N-glycosylase/hydrolase n=1 Tax=Pseudocohnilembus persalinus TaxID=266149 RepID=A0A0V0QG40_PSEPJ|nr:hypothetical protein PPERSA_03705 [Pseudocohnilembus persalinus]|eukprot:KRX01201.1 hypothetical protein PPERSA_03705 [Pseudocohnilembus persalinus]